jgi:hypothetical protein
MNQIHTERRRKERRRRSHEMRPSCLSLEMASCQG